MVKVSTCQVLLVRFYLSTILTRQANQSSSELFRQEIVSSSCSTGQLITLSSGRLLSSEQIVLLGSWSFVWPTSPWTRSSRNQFGTGRNRWTTGTQEKPLPKSRWKTSKCRTFIRPDWPCWLSEEIASNLELYWTKQMLIFDSCFDFMACISTTVSFDHEL